jgi:hypothetical protein
MPRTLVLLFDDTCSRRVEIDPHPFHAQQCEPDRRTLVEMVTDLASTILLGWEIKAFSCDSALTKGLQNQEQVDLAIADLFFERDDPLRRDKRSTLARDVLTNIKARWPKARCILAATLPERPPERLDDANQASSQSSAIDAFVPLAHTNANPWDELYNLFKREESKLLFRTDGGSKGYPYTSNPTGVVEIDHDVVIDCHSAAGSAQAGIEWSRCHFKRRVIFKNCNFAYLRIRACRFSGPVLFYQCSFERSSFVAECDLAVHLNVVSCTFASDIVFERNDFGRPAQGSTQAGDSHRLPWFDRVTFRRQFVFRNNFGPEPRPTPWPTSEPGVPNGGTPHTLMCHACEFEGRVDLVLPEVKTKLAMYQSSFHSGQDVEISYPYDTQQMRETRNQDRFRLGGRYREVVEIRLSFCNLAARIVIREHPWPVGKNLAKEFAIERPDANAMLPIQYDANDGLGLNLHGATLSGSLNVRYLRIKWINCERMAVLGGALFMNRAAIRKSTCDGSWIEQLKHWRRIGWDVAAESTNIIFEEQYALGEEDARFSAFFQHSPRLMEYSRQAPARVELLQNIVQQYDDLRKAFRNASNSHAHEDFCQYKTMMYIGRIGQILYTQAFTRPRSDLVILLTAVLVVLLTVVYGAALNVDVAGMLTAGAYLLIGAAIICLFCSKTLRRYVRWRVDRVIYRKGLCYLIYPSRAIATALLTIGIFAGLYGACDTMSYWWGHRTFGAIIDVSQPPGNDTSIERGVRETIKETVTVTTKGRVDGADEETRRETVKESVNDAMKGPSPSAGPARQSIINHFCTNYWRMLHFSAVTFTTLGYGDEQPIGVLRPVSNVEALIGALFIALITVAIGRQFIRA